MGAINFDQTSHGTITGQPIGLKVSNTTDQSLEDFNLVALWGSCPFGEGVRGESSSSKHAAVAGDNSNFYGVSGTSASGFAGVFGSGGVNGVYGQTNNPNASGVYGQNDAGGPGVAGSSQWGPGLHGRSQTVMGVLGESTQGDGVFGTTGAAGMSGVAGIHTGNGHGVYGRAGGEGFAGWFDGNVMVSSQITAYDVSLAGGDCAEEFDIAKAAQIEPGTVMVLDQEGALRQSEQAYDKRVAGVISGAGDYKPGIVLDKQPSSENRVPIALVGKVYCKVDAQYACIQVGDLLTTSPTPGHAMKADDPFKAFGSVIGKALRSLEVGQGMIPILISLQ